MIQNKFIKLLKYIQKPEKKTHKQNKWINAKFTIQIFNKTKRGNKMRAKTKLEELNILCSSL
jgi:hypothetical protein